MSTPSRPESPAAVASAEPASSDASLPLVRALQALDNWQRDPAAQQEADVAGALRAIADAWGARGAILEISAPPVPTIRVGVGTLTGPDVAEDRDGLTMVPVGSHAGHPALGRLILDAPEPAAGPIARIVELAVDAAWSRAEVHARAERLSALEAATRAVAAELDIDRVLQLIVDRVRELVGARYAALGIADARGRIERFVTSGISPEERAAIGHVPHGRGLLGKIIREGRTIRVDDISSHPASSGFPARHPRMTTFLGVPVPVKGRTAGNFYLADRNDGRPFTDDDARLIEMFGVHAGIAIENARLHDQVQRLAIVEERERIGKDLHDGIIQSIYGVGLSLEDVPDLIEDDRVDAVARIDRAIDALNLVISDIRSYILRLRPLQEGDEDPVESLARLGEEIGIHAMLDLETDLERGADRLRGMAPDRRSDLLFVAREALSNVARHAGATRAEIRLERAGGGLRLVVEDNGRGFDPGQVQGPDAQGRHQGLTNMRDRVVGMGGSFVIERPEPSGTRIIVDVPASPDDESEDTRPPGTGEG